MGKKNPKSVAHDKIDFKLSKDTSVPLQEAHTTPNRQDQSREFPWQITVKILSIYNKNGVLKAPKQNKTKNHESQITTISQ